MLNNYTNSETVYINIHMCMCVYVYAGMCVRIEEYQLDI